MREWGQTQRQLLSCFVTPADFCGIAILAFKQADGQIFSEAICTKTPFGRTFEIEFKTKSISYVKKTFI